MIEKKTLVISAILLGVGFWAIGCGGTGKGDTKAKAQQGAHTNHADHDHNAMKTNESSSTVAQKTCPVMGSPINKALFVDYNGKRIYLCCSMCINQVKADPEKYLKKLAEMGEQPENIQ